MFRSLPILALLVATAGASTQTPSPPFVGPRPDSLAPAARRGGGALGTTDTDRRRLAVAADALLPQRPGTVDAYVIVAALDSDPVFGREAREAAKVLARRYGAEGRTLLLAGYDGRSIDPLPRGSPETLGTAIARVAAVMDPAEDALILYITAHGSPSGIAYRDHGAFLGEVPPVSLDDALRQDRVRNRLVIVSACFSGIFVPKLATPEGAIVTAAARDRTSFGCASDNDWTFFGDAFVNHALRKAQPLGQAFAEARGLIGGWEARGKLIPSNPQIAIGARAAAWLQALDARTPKEPGTPVGRPATDALDQAVAANH